MTDIGISCAKHSYGRGVGKIPMTCRADEDLWGLLCYPKCKPGYSQAGCCLCSKSTKLSFKLMDAVDAVGDIFDAIYDIPVLGWILKAFDAAVEAILKPIIDAIPGLPKPFSMSLGANFDMGALGLKNLYDDLVALVKIPIEKMKEVMKKISNAVPNVPDVCPELSQILTRALGFTAADLAVAAGGAGASLSGMALLTKAYNSKRGCLVPSNGIVQNTVANLQVKNVGKLLKGSDDTEKEKRRPSKKKQRKREQKKAITKSLFKGGRMVATEANACTVSSASKNGKRQLVGEEKTLQVMVDVSVTYLEDMTDDLENQGAKAITSPLNDWDFKKDGDGYYIQRLELSADGKTVDEVECIWDAGLTKDGKPTMFPFKSKAKKKKANLNFSVKTTAAAFSWADIATWGVYYIPKSKFKKGDWEKEIENQEGPKRKHAIRCGEGAGFRVSGDFMVPHAYYITSRDQTYYVDKVTAGAKQTDETWTMEAMKKQNGNPFFHIETLKVGKKSPVDDDNRQDDAAFTIIIGPSTDGTKMKSIADAARARTKEAMFIARNRVATAISVLTDVKNRRYNPLPPWLTRYLQISFGVKLIPNEDDADKYDGNPELKDDVQPLFETIKSKADLKSKIEPIIAKYKKVQAWLNDISGKGTVIRHSEYVFEHQNLWQRGVVKTGKVANAGSIYVDLMQNPKGGTTPDNAFKLYRIANLIVHEASHSVVRTMDYFYISQVSNERLTTLVQDATVKSIMEKVHKSDCTAPGLDRLSLQLCDSTSSASGCILTSTNDCENGESALEPGWNGITDPASGRTYYHNAAGATTWEKPTVLQKGWEEKVDPSGKTYYLNNVAGKTQWDRPPWKWTQCRAYCSLKMADFHTKSKSAKAAYYFDIALSRNKLTPVRDPTSTLLFGDIDQQDLDNNADSFASFAIPESHLDEIYLQTGTKGYFYKLFLKLFGENHQPTTQAERVKAIKAAPDEL